MDTVHGNGKKPKMVLFVKLKAIFNEYHIAMYEAVTSVGDNVSDVSDAALDACATIDVLAVGTQVAPAHLSVTFTACITDTAFPSALTLNGLTFARSSLAYVVLLFTLDSVFLSALVVLLPSPACLPLITAFVLAAHSTRVLMFLFSFGAVAALIIAMIPHSLSHSPSLSLPLPLSLSLELSLCVSRAPPGYFLRNSSIFLAGF